MLHLGAGACGVQVVLTRTGPDRWDVDISAPGGRRVHRDHARYATLDDAQHAAAALAATL